MPSHHPGLLTSLVTIELHRNYDISEQSKRRLANEGQVTEVKEGHKFLSSVCSSEERRARGVSFAVRFNLISRLPLVTKRISGRVMTLQLSLRGKRFAMIIIANTATMTNPEIKYNTIKAIPRKGKRIVLEDFSAREDGRPDLGRWNWEVWRWKMQQQQFSTFERAHTIS